MVAMLFFQSCVNAPLQIRLDGFSLKSVERLWSPILFSKTDIEGFVVVEERQNSEFRNFPGAPPGQELGDRKMMPVG
jgi:hypothetical protein